MRLRVPVCCLVLTVLFVGSHAVHADTTLTNQTAQPIAADVADDRTLQFEFAKTKLPSNGQTQVINGQPVQTQLRDWPTVAIADLAASGNLPAQRCTSTLVGPAVLLLAAHCLD